MLHDPKLHVFQSVCIIEDLGSESDEFDVVEFVSCCGYMLLEVAEESLLKGTKQRNNN